MPLAHRAIIRRVRFLVAVPIALGASTASAQQSASYTLEQVKSYPFPNELTAAATGSQIAWALNERGLRNVFVAEGPEFRARQLTSYRADDGQELTSVSLSPDGRHVVYVRGGEHGSNWDDELPVNPASSPIAPKPGLWSVPFGGGEPKLLAEGGEEPAVSPRADVVAFVKDRQLWIVPIDGSQPAKRILGAVRGEAQSPRWSPDGSRIAFVSNRGDHAFIGIFTNDSTPITWLAPSTSRDGSPRWSPDGTRIAFIRRPGTGGAPDSVLVQRHVPWAIWTANAATGEGRQL
jgi:Tol biopolymer transport system component